MNAVTEAWRRIETWLQTFAPTRAKGLRPGVTPEELADAEKRMGLILPEDFKASYSIHDGDEGNYLLMGYSDFYLLSYVYSFREIFHDLLQDAKWASRKPGFVSDPARQSLPIQQVWCHPEWIAFAGDGSGYHWCLDLAPAPGGTRGQIITWDHEDGPANLLFPSFAALLAAYADQLEAGYYVGINPIIQLSKLTHLQERRAAFQEPSPGKPMLYQAIKSGWESGNYMEESLDIFRDVLQLEAATPEDRFFAYYAIITWCVMTDGDDEVPMWIAQLEAEASQMPPTHWIHEEAAQLRRCSM